MKPEQELPERRSVRLKNFDYSAAGVYFFTVCAHEKRCIFGRIEGGATQLNSLGRIVQACWLEVPRHFAGVETPAHVVMPNHFHGVVVIHRRARHAVPLRPEEHEPGNVAKFGGQFGRPVSGSLSTLVGSFKSAVTKRAKEQNLVTQVVWQRGFYERVIRDGKGFATTCRYIWENPVLWEFDEENPGRISK